MIRTLEDLCYWGAVLWQRCELFHRFRGWVQCYAMLIPHSWRVMMWAMAFHVLLLALFRLSDLTHNEWMIWLRQRLTMDFSRGVQVFTILCKWSLNLFAQRNVFYHLCSLSWRFTSWIFRVLNFKTNKTQLAAVNSKVHGLELRPLQVGDK